MYQEPTKQTPDFWAVKWRLRILDADGWTDKSFDEEITEREFFQRAAISTCTGNLGSFRIFQQIIDKDATDS